ncbi:hypothetical protein N510_001717 [Firmicutes bacterium ASF500]|nr:hypothetical protein N510_001717 [Firmicutes bacterium ASF500]
MRTLSRWLSRFSYNHPNLSVEGLIRYIVGGNLLVFMLDLFTHGVSTNFLTFVPAYIFRGQIWRLITFIFVPMSFSPLTFILSTVFFYYMGVRLEGAWGSARFTIYYGLGVLLNILVGLLLPVVNPMYMVTITASMHYLHLAMFFAYATLYPDLQVLFMFIIPIRIKWLALLDAALFAYDILSYLSYGHFAMALLPIIAIFNYFIFFWDDLMDYLSRGRARAVHQHSAQTINFKKAQKDLRQRRGYLHKCTVCGITDQDNPDMEFRYCSKCNGYYCYCTNHINNHTHVQ